MKNQKNNLFIIAFNLVKPRESIILARSVTEDSVEKLLMETNLSNFTGKGIVVYSCLIKNSVVRDSDLIFEIDLSGEPTVFEVKTILEVFPLIEGEVTPGIYKFYADDFDYSEIKNATALTQFFSDDTNFEYDAQKLICRSSGIAIQKINENKDLCFFERLPLTYFDVHCPVCQTKVITHETDSPENILCSIVENPCAHYVKNITFIAGSYEEFALKALKRRYSLQNQELFLESSAGRLEKALIYIQPESAKQSFWGKLETEKQNNNHIIFLP